MDFQTVKAELKRGLNVYQAFKSADDVIAALEGMEQNKRELEAAVKGAKAELATANEKLADVKAAVLKAQDDAKAKAAVFEKDHAARMEAAKNAHAAQMAKYADETEKMALAASNDAIKAANAKLNADNAQLEAKQKAIQDQLAALKKTMGA